MPYKSRLIQTILIALILVLGLCGYFTKVNGGLELRKSIASFSQYNNELHFLKNTPKQKACLDYLNLQDSLFTYCKISNATYQPSVAIIGDSHANAAYDGFSKILEANHIGSILLADAGNPLYQSEDFGQVHPYARMQATNQILQVLRGLKEVREVYIFTRGPLYLTGTEPITGENIVFPSITSSSLYLSSIQSAINELNISGREVKPVIENPEFHNSPRACARSIPYLNTYCSLSMHNLIGRQKTYRELLGGLVAAKVIDASSVFCNDLNCSMFDAKENLLYVDDDHLSRQGSFKQAQYILSLPGNYVRLRPYNLNGDIVH